MIPIPFLYHCVSQMTNIKSDRSLFHWWHEHGHEALYMFNLKLWNTSAVTEKFAPDVKFTQPEFPLIKLDKFVHSHLNLFICLSFLFFPNQTFLLKPARKTIDFFFSFCKFCLRFILLRPEFSSQTPTWNSSIGFVPYNHYAQHGGFPRRPTGNMKQTKGKMWIQMCSHSFQTSQPICQNIHENVGPSGQPWIFNIFPHIFDMEKFWLTFLGAFRG